MNISIVELRDGNPALARYTKDGMFPYKYTNFKQADKKVSELREAGIRSHISGYGDPAKYIIIDAAINLPELTWTCPACGHSNQEIDFSGFVVCRSCEIKFSSSVAPQQLREYAKSLSDNLVTEPTQDTQEEEKPLAEYVYIRMPSSAWDVLSETLEVDSRSSNFDRSLRDEIEEALAQVEDNIQDPLTVYRDFQKFLASLPHPENNGQGENRQAIQKIVREAIAKLTPEVE